MGIVLKYKDSFTFTYVELLRPAFTYATAKFTAFLRHAA